MKKLSAVILISLFVSLSSVQAEKRLYQYYGNAGAFASEFIDAMTESGIQFSVQSVYNEKKDGKQGMVLKIKPSGNFCEVTFAEKNKGTVISLFTQNTDDLSRMNLLFIRRMKMKEVVPEKGKPSGDWNHSDGWPNPYAQEL